MQKNNNLLILNSFLQPIFLMPSYSSTEHARREALNLRSPELYLGLAVFGRNKIVVLLIVGLVVPANLTQTAQGLSGNLTFENVDVFLYRIIVETDSDWTEVFISGGPAGIAANYTITRGSDASQLIYSIGPKSIFIGKKGLDTTPVTILVDVLATKGEEEGIITIKKGDLGSTKVSLYTNKDLSRMLWGVSSEGPNPEVPISNDRSFSVVFSGVYRGEIGVAEYYTKPDSIKQQVFSFYYPWYGTPHGPSQKWFHWEGVSHDKIKNSAHYPLLGVYDSKDERVIEAHISMAKHAGINGFIVSWWGIDSYEEQTLSTILSIAGRYGFKITIYYESYRGEDEVMTVQKVVNELSYLIKTYSQSPSFLKVDGIPVVFIYAVEAYERTPDFWFKVRRELESVVGRIFLHGDVINESFLDVFDGFHTYIQLSRNDMKEIFSMYSERMCLGLAGQTPSEAIDLLVSGESIKIQEKINCYTIVPGYDDTKISYPGFILDRDDGETYRRYWSDAIESGADWILITSWNELHEGTEIEPSREYEFNYINLTRLYVEEYKQIDFPIVKAVFSAIVYPFELYPDFEVNSSIILAADSEIPALLVNVEISGKKGVSQLELRGDIYTYLKMKNETYISIVIPSIQQKEKLVLHSTFKSNMAEPLINVHIKAFEPSGKLHELFKGKMRVSDKLRDMIEHIEALKRELKTASEMEADLEKALADLSYAKEELSRAQSELASIEKESHIWQLYSYTAIISAIALGLVLILVFYKRR